MAFSRPSRLSQSVNSLSQCLFQLWFRGLALCYIEACSFVSSVEFSRWKCCQTLTVMVCPRLGIHLAIYLSAAVISLHLIPPRLAGCEAHAYKTRERCFSVLNGPLEGDYQLLLYPALSRCPKKQTRRMDFLTMKQELMKYREACVSKPSCRKAWNLSFCRE